MAAPVTTPDPAAEALAMHRDGRLAQAFPRVRELLAAATEEQTLRVGRLLSRLPADEVLAAHPGVPVVNVAVTGHGTLAALVPALAAELARHGIVGRIHVGAYDGYVFDLADPASALYAARPELVLCVLDAPAVLDLLPVPWTPDDVARLLSGWLSTVEGLVDEFDRHATGTLVLNTLPLPVRYPAQLVDHRSRARLGAVWREANARLLRLAERGSTVVIDLDPLVADGIRVEDPRQSVYAKAHLSPQLLSRYAREAAHLARHLKGRTDKCLVLDLDETLWGGVLGETGPDGIEVGEGYRGEAFTAFQRVVKQLGAQGVLLAAVSKNAPEPVREVLSGHPRMLLRDNDFVRVVANWRPKHENLVELAAGLNLGVDSFVFVDDSAYERGLVHRELPEVAVVGVDDEPALHVERLLRDGWFTVRELTAEDTKRPALYREELDRQDFLSGFASLEDYLRELGVWVRLARVSDADVPRVSQLTLRTNQFNLTTDRLQPADVRGLLADPDALPLAVRVGDRFGDNGLVGAVFARRADGVLRMDNFVLSCRVFSRGVEAACLSAVLGHARACGMRAVHAGYRPTAKNGIVADFYPRYGFVPTDGTGTSFRHDLVDIVAVPEHVDLTTDFGKDDE